MWDPTDNWAQQGSFVQPVVPPTSQPGDFPLVCIEVNQLWIPYILGALQQLVQPTSWTQGAGPITVEDAQDAAQDLIGIIGTSTVCHLAPDCAGIDGAHNPTFTVKCNAVSVLNAIAVSAGRTAGGTPISWLAQDLAVSAPGNYQIGVDADGILHLVTSGSLAGDQVLIADVVLEGNGGVFHAADSEFLNPSGSVANESVTFNPADLGTTIPTLSTAVLNFPISHPIALPTFTGFTEADFRNSATPAASYTGYWSYENLGGESYIFNDPTQVDPIDLPGGAVNELQSVGIETLASDELGGSSGVYQARITYSHLDQSNAIPDATRVAVTSFKPHLGGAFGLGPVHYSSALTNTFSGIREFTGLWTGGVEVEAQSWAACYPHITITRHMSTC